MTHPITVVDSFTDTPFGGNPAGVCVLAHPTTEAWMRAVAAELNLAETAFLVPRPDGDRGITMDFPAIPVAPVDGPALDDWAGALGVGPGRIVGLSAGGGWTLV